MTTAVSPEDLNGIIDSGSPERRAALVARIRTVVQTLEDDLPDDEISPVETGEVDDATLLDRLDRVLRPGGASEVWLARAVVTAEWPDPPAVMRTLRTMRLDGPRRALAVALDEVGALDEVRALDGDGPWRPVEVITDRVIVDAHHTFAHPWLRTGIQRVSRETVERWRRDHDPVFVLWEEGYVSVRRMSGAAIDLGLHGSYESRRDLPREGDLVVPWQATLLVPELPADVGRVGRFQAFAAFSRSTTGIVGFDCVPLTAAETTAEGMAAAFSTYLAAAAESDRIATISESAATEYRGWRRMLSGAGLRGPEIEPVPLPIEAREPTPAALGEARQLLGVGPLPVVLSVGSHEPRKNHLAVLHAAELLWREGLDFTLAFVGGNAWNSEHFDREVVQLQQQNRPLQAISRLSDDLLWAAYRLAHCTVFISVHEGYGLPVAESLASGTPVITSNFGSMRDIARSGGALLVDPRDVTEVVGALRRLLTDAALRDRLAAEARATPLRSWDDYARETWDYLVDGNLPR